MWREEEEDDDNDNEGNEHAPTYDEEEGLPAPSAAQQPQATTIPDRTAEAEAGGSRQSALPVRASTLSSLSASGNTNTNRVSWHQHQQQQPQPRQPWTAAGVASADVDVDGAGSGSRSQHEAAARGHSLSSFPSFHTTQALPLAEEAGGITVVEDVRALGHVENHILVLLPKAVDKIQYLLRPLRAQFLKGTPFCKRVVFLTEAGLGALERHCRSLEVRSL